MACRFGIILFTCNLGVVLPLFCGCSCNGDEAVNEGINLDFPIGTHFDQVEQRLGKDYRKLHSSVNYLDGGPTPEQRESDASYLIVYDQYGVQFEFNHNDNLINIYKL